MLRTLTLALLSVAVLAAPSWAQPGTESALPPPNDLQQAAAGMKTLQSWYTQDTGLYRTTGWWNSANAITVLVNYSRVSHDRQYLPVLPNTLRRAQITSKGFLNKYYDDEGWWALAWIDAYDLTGNRRYLAMASSIFADMAKGWDNTCEGGIWWSKDRKYKNAIANELFLSVAAHLAARTKNPHRREQYATWAKKEWQWFAASGMINEQHLVNDGLDLATCKNNGKNTWSYNQGVLLGGLVELNRTDPDPTLPRMAQSIAQAALTHLTDPNGILHDTCEPKCGADGVQFKGIFVRNLMALQNSFPDPRYKTFMDANARSIWTHAQGPNRQFGQVWSGPFDSGSAGRQSSALDVLVAAASVASVPR
jgi:predicted alpha-1,6-mannanase (GH76 family)